MDKRKHHRNNYLIGTKTSRNAKAAALDEGFKILQEILASSVQGTIIESNPRFQGKKMQDLFTLGIIKGAPFPLQVIIYSTLSLSTFQGHRDPICFLDICVGRKASQRLSS